MAHIARLACFWLFACGPAPAQASEIGFGAAATIEAAAARLTATLELELLAAQPVYQLQASVVGQRGRQTVHGPAVWRPGQTHTFAVAFDDAHRDGGQYHLLVGLRFQDRNGAWLNSMLAFPYTLGEPAPAGPGPEVAIAGTRLGWTLAGLSPEAVSLTLLAEPLWQSPLVLTARRDEFRLQPRAGARAVAHRVYPQLARLDWQRDGRHYSRILHWQIVTGADGEVVERLSAWPRGWWREPLLLYLAALACAGAAVLTGGLRPRRRAPPVQSAWQSGLGWLGALALSAWLFGHTRPDLWLTPTWITGGDTASHILYADAFADWLVQGRVSGWMPEVFAGFPAFLYYFPLPFALIVLLTPLFGIQVGIKLVAMSPALLLPLATHWWLGRLAWPAAARLLGAAGAAAFILNDSNSIWGGNLLSQLSGEFAYSWGLLLAVAFWGALAWALRHGGRRWLLAAVLEALVALSHGYALLIAGFGAFALVLPGPAWAARLRTVLLVHALAFLLIGFWLIPLIDNLPWTIPNDTPLWISDAPGLLSRAFWPLLPGLLMLPWVFFALPRSRAGVLILAAIALLAVIGFLLGDRIGLANIRFFPYAQWSTAVLAGAAGGWLLWRWLPRSSLWCAAAVLALFAWWEPHSEVVEGWSRWNLEGYEAKPLWGAYRALAAHTAGALSEPRVVFEHDPDNIDLGSTRTLEALPLFGSRPVLEGLYMESALCGPFIYQLQAELSARPSSPLSRFPAARHGLDAAVAHLNEFYADTVIVRSEAMNNRLAQDPRFVADESIPPFAVYRLAEPDSALVEVEQAPLLAVSDAEWLRRAFRRFRRGALRDGREVYPAPGQAPPESLAPAAGAAVQVTAVERERLRFVTDAVGQPHLVRMAYHPNWRSSGGEPVHLAEPCFMLITPQQREVELVYRASTGYTLGLVMSGIGLLLMIAVGTLKPRFVLAPRTAQRCSTAVGLAVLCALAAGAALLWFVHPERAYYSAHARLRAGHYESAAQGFESAYAGRANPASKAEALFWSVKSREAMGHEPSVRARYLELVRRYPESYWAPEALYRAAQLPAGEASATGQALLERLLAEYPESVWSEKARTGPAQDRGTKP